MKSIAAYAMITPAMARFGVIFMLWSLLGGVQAAPAGTTMPAPPELQQSLPQARLAGSAKLRVLGFEVYWARLWVQPNFEQSRFAEHDFALELQYLRELKGADIAKRSLKEMQRVTNVSEAQAQSWLKAMQDIFPDVKQGDRLTGVHSAEGSARFVKNGQVLGEVKDAQFAQAFFAIWLSPQTSQPRLREQLLAHARGTP
jgi:Chalcone isomerase-like